MKISGVSAWVHKLAQQEMPALGNIISELNRLTGDDDTDAHQLAEVILKDGNLTSQVLRIANSVQFNPSGTPLTTVSRAIVLVGFQGIRDICLSVSIIETLLGAEPREHLLDVMARGFHAGSQARWMTPAPSPETREEVFVAALLQRLGEMAFWAYGGTAADELASLIDADPGADQAALERQVLGTNLRTLSRALCELWHLGPVLNESLNNRVSLSPQATAVTLGTCVSEIAHQGWDKQKTTEIVSRIAAFTGQSAEQARTGMFRATEEAAAVALRYGATRVCHLISTPREPADKTAAHTGDPLLQLSILRELTTAVTEKLDLNTVFQMAAEGIHRGIGFERVAVLFLLNERCSAKYLLGSGTERWRREFSFPVTSMDANLFTLALEHQEQLLFDRPALFGESVRQVIGNGPVVLAPVSTGTRVIGFFYADRGLTDNPVTEDMMSAFRHFALQTRMTLQMIASTRHNNR
ncbi:MAG: HDOD domain-containing protein [Pseudomonadales bacterium]|nr:HDOD domain-containing protein [Pseudomonadales bacterium]